jgi:cyclopropane fatty-acyl-phospholipid synthase-like methyltransferase
MSDPRAISHGEKSSNKGERGITKRLDALATLTPLTGHRLLDIGCADGSYTRRLAEGFDQVDAIDIEVERLDDFREAGPGWIAVAEMSADALSYPDNTFDVITAIEVMEHVGDVDAVLAEVARVLVPGGRFLVTTPNRWFPFETHKPIIAGKRRRPWVAPGLPWIPAVHRRFSDARAFTASGLARQASAAGLTMTGHTYIMPPFDASPVGKRIRPVTDWIEGSSLSFLGMALVATFEKA